MIIIRISLVQHTPPFILRHMPTLIDRCDGRQWMFCCGRYLPRGHQPEEMNDRNNCKYRSHVNDDHDMDRDTDELIV